MNRRSEEPDDACGRGKLWPDARVRRHLVTGTLENRDVLAAIGLPTLVCHGDADAICGPGEPARHIALQCRARGIPR